MTDPRAALAALTAALERHLEASAARHGENDPIVVAAYQDVADAFDAYDEALLQTYGEVTPLEVYGADEDEYDEDEDDDEDDEDEADDDDQDDDEDLEELDDHGDEDGDTSGVYLGLDDSDFDDTVTEPTETGEPTDTGEPTGEPVEAREPTGSERIDQDTPDFLEPEDSPMPTDRATESDVPGTAGQPPTVRT